MAMEGRTTCAVEGCIHPISGSNNLCDEHRLPGGVVRVGNSTMVIIAWYAEHGDEAGIILINDWALGVHFGGGAGFEQKLVSQGFVNVRILSTPAELEAARTPAEGKQIGDWGGHWRTQYPWELSPNTSTGVTANELSANDEVSRRQRLPDASVIATRNETKENIKGVLRNAKGTIPSHTRKRWRACTWSTAILS